MARAARPYTSAEDRAAIRRVVILLDAMPLAVELAAARTQLMTPADICARLEERLDFLGDRRKDARQATLQSAIEWSWNLLTEAERVAFAQCAVFRGGFTLEAAEAVLDLSTVDGPPRSSTWSRACATNPCSTSPRKSPTFVLICTDLSKCLPRTRPATTR